jgi:uncharacterized protein (TIGR02246 family)
MLTGVILGSPDGAAYVTGLGNALLRLDPATSMNRAQLTELATRYAAAWSRQSPEELASFYAEAGSLAVNDGTPSTGRAAIAAKAKEFMDAFPDMVVELDAVERHGGRVTFHWTWTGTNTGPGGTGKSVRISGYEEWTLGPGGLIETSLGHYDEAEYERQVSAGGAGR